MVVFSQYKLKESMEILGLGRQVCNWKQLGSMLTLFNNLTAQKMPTFLMLSAPENISTKKDFRMQAGCLEWGASSYGQAR